MRELTSRTVAAHGDALSRREYSAEELTLAYLDAIAEKDGAVGAYLSVFSERALASARRVDRRRAAGEVLPPLAGIPCAIKDNLCLKNEKTTCGSKMLENYVPPYTAFAAERLEQNGAVVLGKTNMDEFGMGSSTENSAFRFTRNPVDPSRVPGGSSGGSAAAVAAGEAAFALGSDTGGSIRQPAAFCGLVGMKPTYGAVSRRGLVAFASSLDQIGPLTRTVRDNALVLNAIAGNDAGDATSRETGARDFTAGLADGVTGMKIGIVGELFDAAEPDVRSALEEAAHGYERLGATLAEVSLPSVRAATAAYYIISSAEASSNLARFDGVRYGRRAEKYNDITELYIRSRSEGFGAEVKRRIMLGTFVLSAERYDAYYQKALDVRARLRAEFEGLLGGCRCLLAPTAPSGAFLLGAKIDEPVEMYACDVCTVPASVAGLPALSVPCGTTREGLPVGMQLIGRAFDEALLYRVGAAYEREGGAAHERE
ncbi:MAG: Asp-tRNA(Asn)/Glu-tRNA(Gln) amidotransferase subunit GatA [Clostridia bacterium]|nr:Asp-tRNA(Asn)/Glu-tRNA(Gln) amidotransferase subunit GatA [Clostridia bacterium]